MSHMNMKISLFTGWTLRLVSLICNHTAGKDRMERKRHDRIENLYGDYFSVGSRNLLTEKKNFNIKRRLFQKHPPQKKITWMNSNLWLDGCISIFWAVKYHWKVWKYTSLSRSQKENFGIKRNQRMVPNLFKSIQTCTRCRCTYAPQY